MRLGDILGTGLGTGLGLGGGSGRDTLRIAVTGLARSGKTVFLTSLLANLLALGRGRDTLPALTRALAAGGGMSAGGGATGGIGVRLVPPASETVPRFEIAAKLAALADDRPEWPARTDDVASVAIEIAWPAPGLLRARLGLPPRRLRLEFLDYPGEWLLDLPMLDLDYAAWSRATLARLEAPARRAVAAPFLDALGRLDLRAPADEAAIRRTHAAYRDALFALRDGHGFRYLQPGRLLCPGPRSDAPFLWFFPAPPGEAPAGSAAALLRARFDAYCRDIRAQAAATGFAGFDRQVVLVDALSALHAGQAAFEDTEAALADIARAYRYGGNTLARWLTGLAGMAFGGAAPARMIERVAFVAAKADHVPASRRPALVGLLRAMAEGSALRAAPARRGMSWHAAAAVRATRDVTVTHDGRTLAAVAGVPEGATAAQPFYAGDFPGGQPTAAYWRHPYFALPAFRPPRIEADGTLGIPHLGLDEVLLALIGDRL